MNKFLGVVAGILTASFSYAIITNLLWLCVMPNALISIAVFLIVSIPLGVIVYNKIAEEKQTYKEKSFIVTETEKNKDNIDEIYGQKYNCELKSHTEHTQVGISLYWAIVVNGKVIGRLTNSDSKDVSDQSLFRIKKIEINKIGDDYTAEIYLHNTIH